MFENNNRSRDSTSAKLTIQSDCENERKNILHLFQSDLDN